MIVACISSSQNGRVSSHSHKVVCTKSLITNAPKNFIYSAAAPEIISISSLVMTACLVLLKVKVSLSIISPGTIEFINSMHSYDFSVVCIWNATTGCYKTNKHIHRIVTPKWRQQIWPWSMSKAKERSYIPQENWPTKKSNSGHDATIKGSCQNMNDPQTCILD